MEKSIIGIPLLIQQAIETGKSTLELFYLQSVEQSANMGARLVETLVILFIYICGFFFLNVALAIWIGVWLHHISIGFLIVGLFYSFIAIVVHITGIKPIRQSINNALIKTMYVPKNESGNTRSTTE